MVHHKLLEELSLFELRRELKNRKLNDKGKKSELVDRLRMTLESQGLDADDFEFDMDEELTNFLNKMTEENRAAQEQNRAAQELNRAAQEENRAAQKETKAVMEGIKELILEGQFKLTDVEKRVNNLEKLVEENTKKIEKRIESNLEIKLNNLVKLGQTGCQVQERIHSVEHAKTPAFYGTVSWSV